MCAGIEQQRGNKIFQFDFQFQLELSGVVPYRSGQGMLSATQACGDFLLCSKIGYTTCYDIRTKKTVWEFAESGVHLFHRAYENELYMWAEERWLAKVRPEDGHFIWKLEIDEEIQLVTEHYLLTYAFNPQSNSGPLLMRKEGVRY